jgi:hypothetical protein
MILRLLIIYTLKESSTQELHKIIMEQKDKIHDLENDWRE